MSERMPPPAQFRAADEPEIVRRLSSWYAANKRDLPWRGADPYGVWVSEIMLQQTQVATVIPYYMRFMERFPTVCALAEASLDAVLHAWSGLGYYARARNLHRAAGMIVEHYGGVIPDSREEIRKLPGIGEYTAGAILSIAYDKPYAAIDANVIRVASRLFGITGDPKSSAAQSAIRAAVERLVPPEGAGVFNQALMELGAMVCDPAEPACCACPLLDLCVAGKSDDPTALPEIPAGASAIRMMHSCVVISNSAAEVLIVQRPPQGLWGGLWEFPRVVCHSGEPPENAAKRAAQEVAGIRLSDVRELAVVKHSVTRYRIALHAYTACADQMATGQQACRAWTRIEELENFALSSPQASVRTALLQRARSAS